MVIDIEAANRRVVEALATGRYVFLDAGCGNGGSMVHCVQRFGRTPGLGLDYYEEDLKEARAAGFEALFCNLLMPDLEFPKACVEFTSAMDVLEHLPVEADAVKVLRKLAHATRDFIFIRHPSFEDIEYLAGYGVKLNWTDWSSHPNMMRLDDFRRIFAEFGWTDYSIVPNMRYYDSRHDSVVPLRAPTDILRYDPALHGPKPIVEFDRPVYGKYDIFVRLNPDIDDATWQRLTSVEGWEAHWEF
jgi:hypothetical protein